MKKGLSRRAYSILTATMALLRSSHGVLWRSNGVLFDDSLRPHGAFTAPSRRVHCADNVLKTRCHLKECRTGSVQTSQTTTEFIQRPLCAPAEFLLRCRRPYSLLRGYGDHTATTLRSIRRPSKRRTTAFVFEHAQSARCRLTFYAIPQRVLAMPLCCCGAASDSTARTTAFYIFLRRRGIAVRTLLGVTNKARSVRKKVLDRSPDIKWYCQIINK